GRSLALTVWGLSLFGHLRRDDLEEGRAVALDARVVLVAGRLVDLGLAAELGVDGQQGQADGLHATVAAALADALVDEDALRRVGRLAALARAAQLGGARLVVDQHRHALDLRQAGLDRREVVAVVDLGDRAEVLAAPLARLAGRDRDLLDALELQPARQLRDLQLAENVLAARHRDGVV